MIEHGKGNIIWYIRCSNFKQNQNTPMKKQTKKSNKKSETPKHKSATKKSKAEEKQEQETEQEEQQSKKQTKNKQRQAETEEEKNEAMENQAENNKTTDQTEQPTTELNPPESSLEPQSRPPYNPETDLNQSQVQALRSRFSHLTKDHFEGGTAEEVLAHLAEVTKTDINELRTVIKAWEG